MLAELPVAHLHGTSVEPHQRASPSGMRGTPVGVTPTAASTKQIVAMIRKILLMPMRPSSFDV
jgi:hypothetical protein